MECSRRQGVICRLRANSVTHFKRGGLLICNGRLPETPTDEMQEVCVARLEGANLSRQSTTACGTRFALLPAGKKEKQRRELRMTTRGQMSWSRHDGRSNATFFSSSPFGPCLRTHLTACVVCCWSGPSRFQVRSCLPVSCVDCTVGQTNHSDHRHGIGPGTWYDAGEQEDLRQNGRDCSRRASAGTQWRAWRAYDEETLGFGV
jgi:hypothetical protein